MKIFPYIALGILGLLVALPVFNYTTGAGMNNKPVLANKKADCPVEKRDRYGRCPPNSNSNFRNSSVNSNYTGGGGSVVGGK